MKLYFHIILITNFLCVFSLGAMDQRLHERDDKHVSQSQNKVAADEVSQSAGKTTKESQPPRKIEHESAAKQPAALQAAAQKIAADLAVMAVSKDNALAKFAKDYRAVRKIKPVGNISLDGYRGYSCAVHPKKNEALIGSNNGLFIWQFGTEGGSFVKLDYPDLQKVKYSPEGNYFAALSWKGDLSVFDADSKTVKSGLKGSSEQAKLGFDFNFDANTKQTFIAVGTSKEANKETLPVQYLDVTAGKKLNLKIPGCDVACNIVANSPDGTHLAYAGVDYNIYFANIANVQAGGLNKLQGHQRAITELCFNAKKSLLASASYDKTARIWDAQSGKCLHVLNYDSPVLCIKFAQWEFQNKTSKNTEFLLSGCQDGNVYIWDLKNSAHVNTLQGHTEPITSMHLNPKNPYLLLTTSMDHTARLWDIRNGKLLVIFSGCHDREMDVGLSAALSGHTDWVMDAAFSADGKNVITVSLDGRAYLWNTAFLSDPGEWTMIRNETLTDKQRGFLALLDGYRDQMLKNQKAEVERPVLAHFALVAEQNSLTTNDFAHVFYSFNKPLQQGICKRYKMQLASNNDAKVIF